MTPKLTPLVSLATVALLASACTSMPQGSAAVAAAAGEPTTNAADLPALRPGIVAGYMASKTWVNSLTLLPKPPAAGSAAQLADEEAYKAAVAAKDSARWQLAAKDAELKFPQAADAFECALGMRIRTESSPHLTMLMRRTLADAGLATYAAKNSYQRQRPFVALNGPMCDPEQDAALRKDGSYPSGHAALGWAWGLVLTEVAPDRANELAQRAFDFSQSRVACGVHWQSDVQAGRDVASAVVAQLHSNPTFNAQLALARKEVMTANASGALKPDAGACKAEAAALGR